MANFIAAREFLAKGDVVVVQCSHQCNVLVLADQTFHLVFELAWLNSLWSQYQAGVVKARQQPEHMGAGAIADYAKA